MQGNYILSFLGAVPMNDTKTVVYLAIDNPKNTIQYGEVDIIAPKHYQKKVIFYMGYIFKKFGCINVKNKAD
jgi:hypothetical protein